MSVVSGWGWILAGGSVGWFAGALIWSLALARATDWATARTAGAWLPALTFGRAAARLDRPAAWHAAVFQLAVAAYVALLVSRWGDSPGWVVMVVLYAFPLLTLLLVDTWTRLLYTNLIAGGVVLALIASTFAGLPELGRAVAGGLVAAAVLGVFYWVAQLGAGLLRVLPIGPGDIYLAAMIGCMVRFDRIFFALFAGLALAALASVLLLLFRPLGARRPLSFGPYLCAGALAALLI